MTTAPSRKRRRWTRDGFLFVFGVLGILNEALIQKEPREVLVLFFGGLVLGVPILRVGDVDHEKRLKEREDRGSSEKKT